MKKVLIGLGLIVSFASCQSSVETEVETSVDSVEVKSVSVDTTGVDSTVVKPDTIK